MIQILSTSNVSSRHRVPKQKL